MDSYGIYAIVLLIAGLIILVFEVFVPSGGFLAVTTTVVLILSACCAFAAWFEEHPAIWWTYCALLVLLIPTTLGSTFYILPKTSVGKKVLLEAPDLAQLEPFVDESARLEKLIGRRGLALTLLNPGGMVLIDGERLHAFSEGILIEPQTEVEVLEIRGTRLLVRLVDESASAEGEDVADADPDAPRPIDFELPGE
jgi:membrane-bound serine protease (ClpP class)